LHRELRNGGGVSVGVRTGGRLCWNLGRKKKKKRGGGKERTTYSSRKRKERSQKRSEKKGQVQRERRGWYPRAETEADKKNHNHRRGDRKAPETLARGGPWAFPYESKKAIIDSTDGPRSCTTQAPSSKSKRKEERIWVTYCRVFETSDASSLGKKKGNPQGGRPDRSRGRH